MKLGKLFASVLIVALMLSALPVQFSASAATSELFFSEYIEGSSFNKAIEIYNGTGSSVDLSTYSLELYSNGSTTVSQSVTLSGILADGDVFVIAHATADAAILAAADATSSTVINYNGDDALVLRNNGVVVDSFGQVGVDPGTEWAGGGLDDTLRRNANVCAGDTNPSDAFDASVEWVSFANNTFDGLGTHTANCGGGDAAPLVISTTPSNNATNVATDANIDITFSEDVNANAGSFGVSCTTSGTHSITISGGPLVFTLDPDADFANSETCTVTVFATQVTDQDTDDPPDTMEADYIFSFDTVSDATSANLVINEIDYDQPSTDTAEFVEIRNNDSVSVDLSAYSIQMINGNAGGAAQYRLFALPAVNLAAGDYFVLCGNASNTPNCDMDVTPDTDLIQNGAPDAVALLFGSSIVDTVSYEGNTGAPYTEGSGVGLEDPGTTGSNNLGISRFPDGVDTNQNNVDFSIRCITPGEANSSSTSGCVVDLPPTVTSTTPTNGATDVSVSNNIDINFSEAVTVDGNWFSITCTNSGAHSAVVSGGPQNYSLDPDVDFAFSESCSVTILAANVVDQDGTANNMPADYNFSFTTAAQPFTCGDTATFIHDVQGSGLTSPLVGNIVVIEGVVVSNFQGPNQIGGYHVQEEDADADADPLTSEGIHVIDNTNTPAIGDVVRVQGTVAENFGLTRLQNIINFANCGSGGVATAATVSLPVTAVNDFERFEGMAVTIPQTLVISEFFNFDRFGEIVLTTDTFFQPTAQFEPGSPEVAQAMQDFLLSRITLDDGRGNQNPDPAIHPNGNVFDLTNLFRHGDTVANVTGVMDFAFSLYRIQPTQGADFTAVDPRPATPVDVGGSLEVASFNVLNYFTTIDTGAFICGPDEDQECRGADDMNELTRQRDKIIAALADMNSDVVGLIEIENHPADVPTADLVSGLNDVLGADTYDYIATGAIGTDAIRMAFIYKPASVSPLGDYAVLDSSVDPRFLDDFNRPALAQTFQDNTTGGIFTVAVNHLKSKGSDCNAIGDPDLGDGAGNCNLTRKAAAEALVDWLATDPTDSGDEDFLIIGDLNSYDKEDPIDAILEGPDDALGTDDDYTDLLFHFMGEFAYSYLFDGQLGYLDHALANLGLFDEVTGTTVWHINADEVDLIDYDTTFKQDAQDAIYAPDEYRSSDHDPVIVGLDVCDEIAPTFDEVSVTPELLWPPNHRYVDVTATVIVTDNFDPNPTITLVSVTSNEPDNAPGPEDGNTRNDIVIVDDFNFKLRAERSDVGTGRIYTITYMVTDACGNSTTQSVTVTVPLQLGD